MKDESERLMFNKKALAPNPSNLSLVGLVEGLQLGQSGAARRALDAPGFYLSRRKPVRVLVLRDKHLFVAARTVVHGLQSSRGERDRFGFGQFGNHLKRRWG